jgi:sec-independent protein translocase protein TatA
MWQRKDLRLAPLQRQVGLTKPRGDRGSPRPVFLGGARYRLSFGSVIGDILQPTHLLFVLVVALLVLGPKRLPEVGRALGRGIRDFRNALNTDELREHMISADDLTGSSTPVQPEPQMGEPTVSTQTVTVPVAQPDPGEAFPSSYATTAPAETAGASSATDRPA